MPNVMSVKLVFLAWVFFYKFATYFQNAFLQEHLWRAASEP